MLRLKTDRLPLLYWVSIVFSMQDDVAALNKGIHEIVGHAIKAGIKAECGIK